MTIPCIPGFGLYATGPRSCPSCGQWLEWPDRHHFCFGGGLPPGHCTWPPGSQPQPPPSLPPVCP